jgi:membrane-bound lytic murein transglycosylase D
MLKSSHSFIGIHNFPANMDSWDCPPALKHSQNLHFSFLDSLPLNPQFEEELLNLFMARECTDYYSLLLQYTEAKTVYDSILSAQNVNVKYAILPLVISGCNSSLKYQSDKSGEWQLSFITARKYGLIVDSWVDERNSRKLSTYAAATYLKFLNAYYLHNELLVTTALLTSVPYVNRRINQLDTINAVNFYHTLDPELQGYFSYLKSWTNWIEHFKQPTDSKKIHRARLLPVETQDTLDFETIHKFMDISAHRLAAINPVLIGKTVFPNTKTAFYLPADKADEFNSKHNEFIAFQKAEKQRRKEELAQLKKQMESGIPDLAKYKAVTYTVKSGDVLGKIASKNNVNVSKIKQWNNLKSDRINIGQKLVLYVPKKSHVSLPEETADNKIETKPTIAKPGIGNPTVYEVKNGDSLWLISQKFPGVSAENIMEWNGCTDKITPGMKLKIYIPTN